MILVRAPVRISFGGGGTDLEAYYGRYGGIVVSCAIARYCTVVASEPGDGSIRLSSSDYHICASFPRGTLLTVAPPLTLPKAAIALFAEQGLCERGVDLFLAAEVPPGTGLGSSSAMAVALVQALAAYLGIAMEAGELAEAACQIEIERLRMPIGKQDQYASAFGGLNSIEFAAHGTSVTPLNLPVDVTAQLAARLLLFSTGRSRDSAKILRRQRAESKSNPVVIESLHRIKALAMEMRAALARGELDEFAALLDQAWQHKRRLSTRISTAQIDRWYAAAREAGALGGKITGAGGGGFLLLYCPEPRQGDVRTALAALGLVEMPFDLDFAGVRAFSGLPLARTGETEVTPMPAPIPEHEFLARRLRRSRSRQSAQ
jgi:D-glycero-alpha-D-manno-heptose-7-phosphate kinase